MSIKVLPAEVGKKLSKFTLKLQRHEKIIKMAAISYSFGKEEVLIELNPKKRLSIHIESESPHKQKEVLRF